MGHDHNQSHDHATGNVNEHRLFWAGLLTGGIMIVEAVGGIYAGSLALIADAGLHATIEIEDCSCSNAGTAAASCGEVLKKSV